MMEYMSYEEVRAGMEALGEKPIAFQVAYARLTGSVTAGLFLSQAVFWTTTFGHKHDGWFFQTQDQWEEITQLSRREQETARKRLKEVKVDGEPVYEEKKKGIPAQLHYRVNLPLLFKAVAAFQSARNDHIGDDQQGSGKITHDQAVSDKDGGKRQTTMYGTVQTAMADSAIQQRRNTPTIKESQEENHKGELGGDTANAAIQPAIIDIPFEEKKPKKMLTGRARGYAFAGVYLRENGMDRSDITERDWQTAATTFEALPEKYTEADVIGCVRYMLSQQWWQEPGRMQPHQVVKTLPKWVATGRPDVSLDTAKANGAGKVNTRKMGGDDWREVSRRIREQRQESPQYGD